MHLVFTGKKPKLIGAKQGIKLLSHIVELEIDTKAGELKESGTAIIEYSTPSGDIYIKGVRIKRTS